MRALVLLAHGSRDPAWAEPFARVLAAVRAAAPGCDARLAFLESMTPDLATAVAAALAAGAGAVTIVPLFLGQGGHVRRDLPALVESLRQAHPGVAIDCVATAGEDDAVLTALAGYCLRWQ